MNLNKITITITTTAITGRATATAVIIIVIRPLRHLQAAQRRRSGLLVRTVWHGRSVCRSVCLLDITLLIM